MLLEELSNLGWDGLCRNTGGVFELKLDREPNGTLAQASPTMLKNLRYLRRRFEKEHGAIRTVRHVLGPDCDHLLSQLECIEAASWVHRSGGETKFVGDRNSSFWRTIARYPRSDVKIAFWVLYSGDIPISFSANLETHSTVYVIANSYDERWTRFSPGSLLTFDVIADAATRGFDCLNWGQGDSGYKHKWGARLSSSLYDVLLMRPGMVGQCMKVLARRKLADWSRYDALALKTEYETGTHANTQMMATDT